MSNRWDKLLSSTRASKTAPSKPSSAEVDALRSPFEADYDRVVYSTPFRRLARKTQVHPLSLNDHVRTRLTHSLEVGCVGRTFGTLLGRLLRARGELPKDRTESDVVWIMLAACAAHDIGNPPFGHAGEYAIREWIKNHRAEVFKGPLPDQLIVDLETFEGNAQGFRLAVRADNPKTGYMRFTAATLGAMVKYPWGSSHPYAVKEGKFNVFAAESHLFDSMWAEMALKRTDGTYQRHPMSYLTEAADDICYRVLDLEDAVEIGILPDARVRQIYSEIVQLSSSDTLAVIRGRVIRALIEGMWKVFDEDYAAVLEGRRSEDLKAGLDIKLKRAMSQIKDAYGEIFAERSKVGAELGAYKALGRIMNAVSRSAQDLAFSKKWDSVGFLGKRCLELAWGEDYARTNESRPYEWWLHQVMDYVAGLTDNYARQLSREIEGT